MGTHIHSTVRDYPRLPYEKITNAILGTDYNLSLVFIGEDRARTLNQVHRKKTYVPNVLSFPLEKKVGEIFITPAQANKEAARRNMTIRGYVGFLLIHGLLHLKGYSHGATMDKAEKKYVKQFALK